MKVNSRGMTLIEVTVATAVASVLIILILNFLTTKVIDNTIQNARADLLREAQLTLDLLTTDIKLSANVDDINRWPDPYAPNAPTDEYSWTSSTDTLVLASPAEDAARNILYDDPFAYISHKNNLVYFVENGTLYKRTIAADISGNAEQTTCPASDTSCPNDAVLAHNVSGFTLAYYDANDVEVSPSQARSVEATLKLRVEKYNRILETEYTNRSVFRNE